MSKNEDFMTGNEKIVAVVVFCGICSLVLTYLGIAFLCCKKKINTNSDNTEQVADVETGQINQINVLDTDDKNIDCSVCLDTDESDTVELSLCGHKFHRNCIHNLNTCPMCRAIIN